MEKILKNMRKILNVKCKNKSINAYSQFIDFSIWMRQDFLEFKLFCINEEINYLSTSINQCKWLN